jgi:hypothetical protein
MPTLSGRADNGAGSASSATAATTTLATSDGTATKSTSTRWPPIATPGTVGLLKKTKS